MISGVTPFKTNLCSQSYKNTSSDATISYWLTSHVVATTVAMGLSLLGHSIQRLCLSASDILHLLVTLTFLVPLYSTQHFFQQRFDGLRPPEAECQRFDQGLNALTTRARLKRG